MITTKAYYKELKTSEGQLYGVGFRHGFKMAMSLAGFVITESGAIVEEAAFNGQDFPAKLTGKEAAFDRYDSY